MQRPGVKAEVERIEREESALLDALLKARQEAGLTQAEVAERMGTQAPAVARLERSLATGKHSPSVATLCPRGAGMACPSRMTRGVPSRWMARLIGRLRGGEGVPARRRDHHR